VLRVVWKQKKCIDVHCCTGARVEEFVYEKVQGSKPQRMLENDVLGQHMIDAGNDFGPGTAYG